MNQNPRAASASAFALRPFVCALALSLGAGAAFLAGCSGGPGTPPEPSSGSIPHPIAGGAGDASLPLLEVDAASAAAATITAAALDARTRFLSHDLLEGRGPGSRGDRLAQEYITTELESMGVEPVNGTWLQEVPLVGIDTRPQGPLRFEGTSLAPGLQLEQGSEFVAVSGRPEPSASLREVEVVFVGYGIQAPEYGWDDFKGVDVRGKALLILNNDPASDPTLFEGQRRLYYGRWDYKYEMAARAGAAGAIIIHTAPSAGYPWQVVRSSWSGEQFQVAGKAAPACAVEAWVTEDAARRIAVLGGLDLDDLRRRAELREFAPIDLGVRASFEATCALREVRTANVLGWIRGRDPALSREVLVYTAHHDHLGLGPEGAPGEDRIYNGAVDNATGVAGLLALARAFCSLPEAPRRTVLFAAVGAEEQGLLGSAYLAAHPPVPSGRLAANINLDSLNVLGRTLDLSVVGRGKTTLDAIIDRIAASQGRVAKGDLRPDQGLFYRSDQFSFAKTGVPGVYLEAGVEYVGRPKGWGLKAQEEWRNSRYHQVTDEHDSAWDLSGAVEDVQLAFLVGLAAAEAEASPAWREGDEFEAARAAALRALSAPGASEAATP